MIFEIMRGFVLFFFPEKHHTNELRMTARAPLLLLGCSMTAAAHKCTPEILFLLYVDLDVMADVRRHHG